MKKYLLLIAALAIVSCKNEPEVPKDYISLSGKIENGNTEFKTITLLNPLDRSFKKEINLNDDFSFSDTMKLAEGKYWFKYGNEYGQIYLNNGDEIKFTLDNDKFDETLKFEGKGKGIKPSNFYAAMTRLNDEKLGTNVMSLGEEDFKKNMQSFKDEYKKLTAEFKLDSTIAAQEDKEFNGTVQGITGYYNQKLALLKELPQGKASPEFNDYENYDGTKTSLKDLKGKYVYVDVWATWCGPCKKEIPSLKKLEKQYHGKNIQFVSLSVDDDRSHGGSWDKAKETWKAMIKDKSLGGIQLFAPKGWQSEFVTSYKIQGIPRFIIIDPDGKIVSPDAPRPSDPALVKMFDDLKI